MQFRSLLAFSLVLLNFCHLSLNAAISGGGKDISFLQCTAIIGQTGSIRNLLYATIDEIATSRIIYSVITGDLKCRITNAYMTLCYKEESVGKVATVSKTYLINVPKTFLYDCEGTFWSTTGETKKLALQKNITNDGRIASSSTRCQGHGWCKNQPGSANYFSNKRCCNPAICFASRSARWHEPVCCYFIAHKQVSSDFTTRMVVKKDTFFLTLSLLASFTVCSVILGILQIKAMGQRQQLKKKEESKRQRRLIDELKAVQTLQRVLDE